MNYLIKDLSELKAVRNSIGLYSAETVKSYLQDIIKRKEDELKILTDQDNKRAEDWRKENDKI